MRFLVMVQQANEPTPEGPAAVGEQLRQTDALMAELRARGQVREWALHADGRGGSAIVQAGSEAELRGLLARVPANRACNVAVTALAEPAGAMVRLRAQGREAWENLLASSW